MARVLSELERLWLDYAREVLEDDVHRQACEAKGGSPGGPTLDPHKTLDPSLRWPGYLGRRYSSGGFLCVATVHRDFDSNGAGAQVRADIVNGTRGWTDGSLTDAEYLDSVRRGYEGGLGKWVVGGNFGAALAYLDVPIDSIAYVNAARCQYPEDFDHLEPERKKAAKVMGGKIKPKLVELCLKRFPISDLLALLEPSVVLFGSTPAYASALPTLTRSTGVLAVCIHPYLTRTKAPLQKALQVGDRLFLPGTQVAEWAPAVRAYLETRRKSP